ncbi:histone deacetylase [Gordonia zhaorongruii]|uniref:histone deacetylase n=1 Tax=Gordonia zhaorongruii TaxID=2597659 RepID=UPI0010513E96|nr:histone deacetylase [Gordonia zhaorongruii]
MSDDLVWYVSYGSNMCADRLACYLQGGRPEGGMRTYTGARDRTPPAQSRPTTLPGRIFFAGLSRNWGGGMAFYDHATPGSTPARAYLITAGQFADVAAQESDRETVVDGRIERALRDHEALAVGDTQVIGDGLYARLVRVGTIDGRPSLTFTSAAGLDAVPHTAPTDAYLTMIARGLRETVGWDDRQIGEYFDSVRRRDPGD